MLASVYKYLIVYAVGTIAAATYLFVLATPIHVVDAVISVRTANSDVAPSLFSGLATFGGMNSAKDEAHTVVTYIKSREALRQINKEFDLQGHYSSSELDFVERLWGTGSFEALYSKYLNQVRPLYDSITGLIHIEVRDHDPELAFKLTHWLLLESELLVNRFNERARQDQLGHSEEQIKQAEQLLHTIESQLTRFRRNFRILDPTIVSRESANVITSLRIEAARVQAELRELTSFSTKRTADIRRLEFRLAAIEDQIDEEQSRLTGFNAQLPEAIEEFGRLELNMELARENYSSAQLSRRNAETEMRRQTLYLVRVVDPAVTVEPRLPQAWRDFAFVAMAFAVGLFIIRMIAKAVGDHG